MARRARKARRARGRRLHVRRVGSRRGGITREEAEVARRIDSRTRAMAGAAGEWPAGLEWQLVQAVAPGAKEVTPGTDAGVPAWHRPHAFGSAGSSIWDQRWRAEERPVERARPRVDDAGRVNGPHEGRRAAGHPGREGALVARAEQPLVRGRGERGEDRRRRGRERRGRSRRFHARDRREERRRGPPRRRRGRPVARDAVRLEDRSDVGVEDGRGRWWRTLRGAPQKGEAHRSARTSDARLLGRGASLRGITLRRLYGRAKPGSVEPETARYES